MLVYSRVVWVQRHEACKLLKWPEHHRRAAGGQLRAAAPCLPPVCCLASLALWETVSVTERNITTHQGQEMGSQGKRPVGSTCISHEWPH